MKKVFALIAIVLITVITPVVTMYAQTDTASTEQSAGAKKEKGHELIKRYFIEGDAQFMSLVLIALILGLAIAIERIITLGLATINSKKFLAELESHLSKGNIEGAKNLCKATRGPVASICYQGLLRLKEGVDIVEKSLISYGSVQMSLLERGLSWQPE